MKSKTWVLYSTHTEQFTVASVEDQIGGWVADTGTIEAQCWFEKNTSEQRRCGFFVILISKLKSIDIVIATIINAWI